LVLRDENNVPVAYAHFRFTVQGDVMDVMVGEPSLFLWDIHVEERLHRKGIARHLLTILELVARQQKMKFFCIPIQISDDISSRWIASFKGYAPDTSLKELVGFDSELEVQLLSEVSSNCIWFYHLPFAGL
jgi:GNAT superfamily N-acetyltransferase